MNTKEFIEDCAEVQQKYFGMEKKCITKKGICECVCPLRDKYNLSDLESLDIARNRMSIVELRNLINKLDLN